MKQSRTLFYLVVLAFISTPLVAQEHHAGHPAANLPIHGNFYSTWFMPDQPNKSCYNKADCYPTEVNFQNGQWFAQRREDGKFTPVPFGASSLACPKYARKREFQTCNPGEHSRH